MAAPRASALSSTTAFEFNRAVTGQVGSTPRLQNTEGDSHEPAAGPDQQLLSAGHTFPPFFRLYA